MAQPSSLYRFRLDISDIDRGVYEKLDFRLALHPSESIPYLITRMLAYALNAHDGLKFSDGGLSDPDAPTLSMEDSAKGGIALWIEIGNPSARRLHKATKASRRVMVYTYKNPENLKEEIRSGNVHRAKEIEIFSLAPEFLERLEAILERDNQWTVLHSEGTLTVGPGELDESGELSHHEL